VTAGSGTPPQQRRPAAMPAGARARAAAPPPRPQLEQAWSEPRSSSVYRLYSGTPLGGFRPHESEGRCPPPETCPPARSQPPAPEHRMTARHEGHRPASDLPQIRPVEEKSHSRHERHVRSGQTSNGPAGHGSGQSRDAARRDMALRARWSVVGSYALFGRTKRPAAAFSPIARSRPFRRTVTCPAAGCVSRTSSSRPGTRSSS
jgi:hypothetical protein